MIANMEERKGENMATWGIPNQKSSPDNISCLMILQRETRPRILMILFATRLCKKFFGPAGQANVSLLCKCFTFMQICHFYANVWLLCKSALSMRSLYAYERKKYFRECESVIIANYLWTQYFMVYCLDISQSDILRMCNVFPSNNLTS